MLSAEQRELFNQRGLLHLPGAANALGVAALRAHVLDHVARRGLVPDPPPPGFALMPSLTSTVVRRHSFAEIWGDAVPRVVDALLGAPWQRPEHSGQLLGVTFPSPDASWVLPHKVWHLDYTAPGGQRGLPGIQVFVCLDRVERHGGGTLVACGTHRLVDALRRRMGPGWPGRSAEVRARLKADVAWLRELWSWREGEDREARFMGEPTRCGDASLQVVELVGEPGDVFAMHPWLLHAPAPNCGARPRMVLTERLHASPV